MHNCIYEAQTVIPVSFFTVYSQTTVHLERPEFLLSAYKLTVILFLNDFSKWFYTSIEPQTDITKSL